MADLERRIQAFEHKCSRRLCVSHSQKTGQTILSGNKSPSTLAGKIFSLLWSNEESWTGMAMSLTMACCPRLSCRAQWKANGAEADQGSCSECKHWSPIHLHTQQTNHASHPFLPHKRLHHLSTQQQAISHPIVSFHSNALYPFGLRNHVNFV